MSYCVSCGRPIPEGQGESCSMCYGDLWYGKDGYALQEMREQMRQEQEKNYDNEIQILWNK